MFSLVFLAFTLETYGPTVFCQRAMRTWKDKYNLKIVASIEPEKGAALDAHCSTDEATASECSFPSILLSSPLYALRRYMQFPVSF